MSEFIKKGLMSIVTGTYQKDGQEKKQYRTIGEIITMRGDDGEEFQFFSTWGPQGEQKGNIYYPDNEAPQQSPAPQSYQPQQPYPTPQQPVMGYWDQYNGAAQPHVVQRLNQINHPQWAQGTQIPQTALSCFQ